MMAQQIQALVGSLESLQASKAADAEAVQDITARITALEGAGLTDVGSRATHASGPAETTGRHTTAACITTVRDLQQLSDLQQRVADLSVMLACAAPLAGAGVDETLLPFMETTSKCLAAHEQQLDAMQASNIHVWMRCCCSCCVFCFCHIARAEFSKNRCPCGLFCLSCCATSVAGTAPTAGGLCHPTQPDVRAAQPGCSIADCICSIQWPKQKRRWGGPEG